MDAIIDIIANIIANNIANIKQCVFHFTYS